MNFLCPSLMTSLNTDAGFHAGKLMEIAINMDAMHDDTYSMLQRREPVRGIYFQDNTRCLSFTLQKYNVLRVLHEGICTVVKLQGSEYTTEERHDEFGLNLLYTALQEIAAPCTDKNLHILPPLYSQKWQTNEGEFMAITNKGTQHAVMRRHRGSPLVLSAGIDGNVAKLLVAVLGTRLPLSQMQQLKDNFNADIPFIQGRDKNGRNAPIFTGLSEEALLGYGITLEIHKGQVQDIKAITPVIEPPKGRRFKFAD